MSTYRFTIDGEPQPQALKVARGRIYNANSAWKEECQKQLEPQRLEKLICWPVELTTVFHVTCPKTWSAIQKENAYRYLILPAKKPDLSNLAYIVENSLTGIVYEDDCLVCAAHQYKVYSKKPRVEILVRAISSMEFFAVPTCA